MFNNPILFALLISLIITLLFFFIYKEKDKKSKDIEKNTKYLVIFGLIFIISLIGKISYNGSFNNIEERIDKIFTGGSNEIETNTVNTVIPPF